MIKVYLIDNASNSNLLDISKDVQVIIINQKVFKREGWWFGYDNKLYPKFVQVEAVTMGV